MNWGEFVQASLAMRISAGLEQPASPPAVQAESSPAEPSVPDTAAVLQQYLGAYDVGYFGRVLAYRRGAHLARLAS